VAAPTSARETAALPLVELGAMALTAALAAVVALAVGLPLGREASPGRIAVLALLTFGGIALGSELSERWEPARGVRGAVLHGYGVAAPVLLAALVLVLVLG
jgi:hypothetical protein